MASGEFPLTIQTANVQRSAKYKLNKMFRCIRRIKPQFNNLCVFIQFVRRQHSGRLFRDLGETGDSCNKIN